MYRQNCNDKSPSSLHGPLPPKSRALFTLAAILVGGAACLLTERLVFRATATRVAGTVIDHDNRGRPVVEYQWSGQRCRYEERGPSPNLPLGATVGIYVPPDGPSSARLAGPIPLLFMPGWACLMPATFFAVYGVIVALRGRRRTSATQARSASEGPGND
jgi:hypothetical protein